MLEIRAFRNDSDKYPFVVAKVVDDSAVDLITALKVIGAKSLEVVKT